MYLKVAVWTSFVLAMMPVVLIAQVSSSLGYWWERTSIPNDSTVDTWRVGVAGAYGFSANTGNAEGHTHIGDVSFALRFRNITALAIGKINAVKTSLGGGIQDIDQMTGLLGSSIGVDVTEYIRPEVGGYLERDNAGFLTSRNTGYAGVTFFLPIDSTVHVSILPAVGVQHELADFTFEERQITTIYLDATLNWDPTSRLSIEQTLRYWQDVQVLTGASDVYRIQWISVISTPVFDFLDLQITGNVRYNNHPIPTADLLEVALRQMGLRGTIVRLDTYVGFRINIHL